MFHFSIVKRLKAKGKRLCHYPLSLCVGLVIIVLSLYPFGHIELAEHVPLADKWTHMVMYGVLAFVIWWENTRSHDHRYDVRLVVWVLLLPIVLGGVLELAQHYLATYRSGEWLDLVADAIGAAVGALVGRLGSFLRR